MKQEKVREKLKELDEFAKATGCHGAVQKRVEELLDMVEE